MLTAIVFWQIVWRANYEISVNLLEEFWNQNLVNLFSSPLRLREWIAGVMLVGAVKTSATIAVGLAASWALYAMNIFAVGHLFIPFLLSPIIVRVGDGILRCRFDHVLRTAGAVSRVVDGYLAAPFSAIYYPLEDYRNGRKKLLPGACPLPIVRRHAKSAQSSDAGRV